MEARVAETIGFTGSRTVRAQDVALIRKIIDILPLDATLITGGCLGVDAEVAHYGFKRGNGVYVILPANRKLADPAWRQHATAFKIMPRGSTYADRNAAIVLMAQKLVGLPLYPEADPRSRRSGTWQTIRMAREQGITHTIFILDEGLTGMPSRMVE